MARCGPPGRPAGQWKGAEEPGQARQRLGPLPRGSSQPCSQGPQPGLGAVSQTCPAFFHQVCQPSGWLWPKGWPQWFCPPWPPIPLGTTGHTGQLKSTLLKGSGLGPRGWSNCQEQRATLDPRRSCQSMICSGRRGGIEAPQKTRLIALREQPGMTQIIFTPKFGLKFVSIFKISFGFDFPC